MDLITTHTNADFDALGSIVAAKKLYPHARLLLPGSQEEAVQDFMSLAKELIVVETEKDCRLDDIDRLIVVDTRQISRIGRAAELLDRGVEVHVYDHHPRMKGDIAADREVYEEVGATITILVDLIRKRRIKLSYLEATLMLLGIYEETGSLTYRTTTKLDVDTVSYLLSQGASLDVVSKYLNRELSEAELALLTKLINLTERVTIRGISVSFIEMEGASYVGELGLLVHKLMDIESIPVLFVLIRTSDRRVDVIARSRLAAVDVNKVLSLFGGGGHPGAAGAKIFDRGDVAAVKKELVGAVKAAIKTVITAEDIMNKQVITVDADDKVAAVKRILNKTRLSGITVVKKGRVAGVITLTGINKALRRGYGHSRVKGYMARHVATIGPDTPLYAIRKIVTERDTGVIPVVSDGAIVGVVSRTDVLKHVHDGLFLKPRKVHKSVILNLEKKMRRLLPREIVAMLRKIGVLANASGASAFVVGGLVRDLVLGGRNLDLDIVIEGNAIRFGEMLAGSLGGTIVIHRKFGTCSVYTKKKLKIDLATARKEIYEKPAALPTVEFSSLKDDLVRRDFTINAMAISLNRASFGQLIDFFGGGRDLAHGRIRVLHDGSFIDDPTRIFRAVRFESRLGFAIDYHTEELIKNAIERSMFEKVEPQRIRDELVLILQEPDPLKAIRRMAELDELRFIHERIRFDRRIVGLCRAAEDACSWYEAAAFRKRPIDKWLVYLMALFEDLTYGQVSAICNRFVFRTGDTARIVSYKKTSGRVLTALGRKGFVAPHAVYRMLEPLSFEVALLIYAKAPLACRPSQASSARQRIGDFFKTYNGTRTSARGDDLKAMGLKPGPAFKRILDKVLDQKIDGRIRTKRDELAYIRRMNLSDAHGGS